MDRLYAEAQEREARMKSELEAEANKAIKEQKHRMYLRRRRLLQKDL